MGNWEINLRETIDDYDEWRTEAQPEIIARTHRRRLAVLPRLLRALLWISTAISVFSTPFGGVTWWELLLDAAAVLAWWRGDKWLCAQIETRVDAWRRVSDAEVGRAAGERWPGQHQYRADSELVLAYCRSRLDEYPVTGATVADCESALRGFFDRWHSAAALVGVPSPDADNTPADR